MRASYRIVRALAFYFSVGLYIFLLPVIISYSLGYKIDFHALKIYKTGIIRLKSNPAGAFIYLNGKQYRDITPARVENLKPGAYSVEVVREGFYPWQKEITVRPNMVTEAGDIVLFPVVQEMNTVTEHKIRDFIMSERGVIYYMTDAGLLRSNMDGTNVKRLSSYKDWPGTIKNKILSPDGGKILYYNENDVWVMYLNLDKALTKDGETTKVEEVFKSSSPIKSVFWYPGFDYIVVVTDSDVRVAELKSEGLRNVVTLYKFKTKPKDIYYDKNFSLYFTDLASEGEGLYLYRLDLKQGFFDKLMKQLKKEFEIRNEER